MKTKTLLLIIFIILSEGIKTQGESLGRQLAYSSVSGINSGYSVFNPKIANLNDSGYVVVWYDSFSDVLFQRFNADGTKKGVGFKIQNVYRCQNVPNVAAASNGDYYISYSDYNKQCSYGTTNNFSIFRMSNQEVVLNSIQVPLQGNYAKWTGIAVLKDGNVACCYNVTNNKLVYSIYSNQLALVFSDNVNNGMVSDRCEVAVLQNGDFLVSYNGINNSVNSINVSIYTSAGTLINSVIPSQNLSAEQVNPIPAALSSGGFVITWDGVNSGVINVYARVYDSSYVASGNEFIVNSNSFNDYHNPSVVELSTGGFMVTFGNSVGGDWNVYIKEYDQNKNPLFNTDAIANTLTTGIQKFPSIKDVKNERYVIAYVSGSNTDILLDVATDIENPFCTNFTQRIDKDTPTVIVFTSNIFSRVLSSTTLQIKLKSLASAGTLKNVDGSTNLAINTLYNNDIIRYYPVSTTSVTFEFFTVDSYNRQSPMSCVATIKVCYMSCNTCSAVGDAINQRCTSCKTDYFPLSDITSRCFTSTTVIDGYFFNMTNFGKCSSNCKVCQSGTICTLCNPTYFLHLVDKKCYSLCPEKFFNDASTNTCKSCVANCKTCSNDSQCSVCDSGSYLHQLDKKCYTNCPDGFFENSSLTPYQCDSCSTNCKDCPNKNTCNICFDIAFLYLDNKCYTTCPNGYYNNTSNGLCTKCPDHCATCTGPSSCTSCDNNYFLFEGSCNSGCPYTFYADGNLNKCLACPDNCRTCSNADTCTLCNANYFLHLINNLCYNICPTNFYGNSDTYRCDACISNCAVCTNTTECISCTDDYFLFNSDKKCYQPCPIGYYGEITTKICTKCPVYYLDGTNICVNKCPLTYYLDNLTGICMKCQANCDGCVNPNECNYCKINYFNLSKEECKTTLVGYWGNYDTRKWNSCPETCLICFGPMKCSTCKPNYFFLPQDFKMCGECSVGYYGDPITRRCTKCIDNCAHCENENECIQCSAGYVLFNKKCWNMCTDGYYIDTQLQACVKCNNVCSKCKNKSEYCISCADGTYYYNQPVPFEGISRQCLTICPNNYYPNDKRECVICKEKNQFLMNNRCVDKCDENYYKDSVEYKCVLCDQPNQFKLRDKCLSKCPDNTYIDSQNRCVIISCTNKCKNGGICTIANRKINCKCPDKYSGEFCEIFTPEVVDLIDVDEPLSSVSIKFIQDLNTSYLKDKTKLSAQITEKVTEIAMKQPELIVSKEIDPDPTAIKVYEAAFNFNKLLSASSNPNYKKHIASLKESMSNYVDLLIKGVFINTDISNINSLFSIQVSGISSNDKKSNRILAETNNFSIIDATACIKALKEKYKIPNSENLIIKKIDFSNDLNIYTNEKNSTKYSNSFIYEFFSPLDKSKLDIEACNNVSVSLKAPNSQILSNFNINSYQKLLLSNLDMFDPNSRGFHDRCIPIRDPITNKDANLYYRYLYYNKKLSAKCPDNCSYLGLDDKSYVKCNCKGMFKNETIANSFVPVEVNPPSGVDQEIVKCSKTFLKSPEIFKNPGFFIGLILFLFGLIILFLKRNSVIKLIKTNLKEVIDYDCNYFDPNRLYARDYFEANKVNFIPFIENVQNMPPAANKRISSIGYNLEEQILNAQNKSESFKNYFKNIGDKSDSTKIEYNDKSIPPEEPFKIGKNKSVFQNPKISPKNENTISDERDIIKKGTSDKLEIQGSSPPNQEIIINYNGQLLPTFKDYKNTSPYITARFDNRNLKKMLFYHLIEEHFIFRLIYQKSLMNPAWLEIYFFCFKLNALFAMNAILFQDSFITNRAENPSKDGFALVFIDEIGKTFLSLISALVLCCICNIFVLIPKNVEEKFNNALMTRKQDTITEAYKIFSTEMKSKYNLMLFITSLFNLFFWYYEIAFCGIYVSTSTGWIYGSIAGLIIDWFVLSLIIPIFRTLVRMCMKSMKLFVCLEYLFWKTKSIRR